MAVLSEYEQKRQETIAKNKALLRGLALDASEAGLGPGRRAKATTQKKASKGKTEQKKVKVEVQAPTRTSSRLKGIVADSEQAKRKADEEQEVVREQERVKRQRITGDLNLNDITVAGHWDAAGNFLNGIGPAKPNERTFTEQHVRDTSDKELKALRERMNGLELWDAFEPNKTKITPERIYSLGFHPTEDKPLVFAGDKLGNLGLCDCSQSAPEVKQEQGEHDDDDEDNGRSASAVISTFKLHRRTISAIQVSSLDPNNIYTASYDSSLRRLDLVKGVSVEVFGPEDKEEDMPMSGIEIARSDPNTVYFSTLGGQFGFHDIREAAGAQKLFQLSDKKIGGFSLHPTHSHLVATASLDRMMRVWDLRKISGKGEGRLPALLGEHESRLSVSHAAFNAAGQVATASYDDTVKIHNFSNSSDWKAGVSLSEQEMAPETIVPHNNQTGRWVTILRAQWQQQPQDGVQRFCIGNMNRFVDIYTGKGEQLAQLGGDGITAVPAVAQFHPTMDWIAAGNASGKLCFWR